MDALQPFEVKVRRQDGSTRVVMLRTYSAIGAEQQVLLNEVKPGETVLTAIPLEWAQKPENAPKPPKRAFQSAWVK